MKVVAFRAELAWGLPSSTRGYVGDFGRVLAIAAPLPQPAYQAFPAWTQVDAGAASPARASDGQRARPDDTAEF